MTSQATLPGVVTGPPSTAPPPVLLLTPSRGLGGGIERYVQTVQSALDDAGVASRRLDLTRPGPGGHQALFTAGAAALGAMSGPARLVIAHRALLPVAALLARAHPVNGISVICHGSDVWGSAFAPRRGLESLLMRRRDVRLVAVSSFTAGALALRGRATILPPGLSRSWFDELVGAADRARGGPGAAVRTGLELMTAFRLADWRDKGLPQLTAAISALGAPDIRLVVCGSGEPPADLLAHVREYQWCALRPGLTDGELAAQFARTDVFALATRTRAGRWPCGEGFGLVLLEAQVAGTAVIGPAHGGSPDAYLEGLTGVTPRDESTAALTRVLGELTSQPDRLAAMGARGASWSRVSFAPDRYAALAVDRLLLTQQEALPVVTNAPPSARPAGAPYLIAGLLLLGVAAVLAIAATSAVSAADQIRWSAIALAAFCAGLVPLMSATAGHDGLGLATWRIGSWSLVWGALAFGLAAISWIGTQDGPSALISPSSILRALWMIAAALALFTAGYCAGPYRLAANRARRATERLSLRYTDQVRGPLVPWGLLGVGLTAQLGYAALTGRFGYVGNAAAAVSTASGFSQYLAIVGECVPLAVVAAAVRAFRTGTPWAWFTLAVLFATDTVVGAVAGGKESFVVAILAVIIPYTVVRRRLPTGAILAAVLVFLLIVIPFNQAYRTTARGTVTLTTSQAVSAAPAIAGQVADKDISLAVLGESASYLAERIRTIDTPAIIMQQTPSQIPFASPTDLLIAPFTDLIPRILWPGKPVLTPGYQISQEYYQLPAQVYTSSDVTPEGDLYRHGGWLPLIIGMFLLGCAIRIIDEAADLRRSVHGAFLIILLFPDIVQAGSDCATLLAGIPGMVLLWLAVISRSFTRRPASGAPRAAGKVSVVRQASPV